MKERADDPGDRRAQILRAAWAMFMRYGFDRTTLADIAGEAGLQRTALYHYFPSKDDVFRALVEERHAATLQACAQVLDDAPTLEAALIALLDLKFGRVLALLRESPHGAELVDTSHRLTGAATRAADIAFQACIAEALARHGKPARAAAVADTLAAAAKGLIQSPDGLVSPTLFGRRMHLLVEWAASTV